MDVGVALLAASLLVGVALVVSVFFAVVVASAFVVFLSVVVGSAFLLSVFVSAAFWVVFLSSLDVFGSEAFVEVSGEFLF
jgi:hypothetical protein